jgi:23S rRNA (pseudouridine1915-N3)-methyltransferase
MRIFFLSIGKAHDTVLSAAIDMYTKRICHYVPTTWVVIPHGKTKPNSTHKDIRKTDSVELLKRIQEDDLVILLDECGALWNNTELAQKIEQCKNGAVKNLLFVIGGAYGVDDVLKKRADCIWSLSKLVIPHMIARLILAEQVYRSFTILKNEKYHHT